MKYVNSNRSSTMKVPEEDCSSNQCDCVEADRVENDTDVVIGGPSNDEECAHPRDCGDGQWCAGRPGGKRKCKDYVSLGAEYKGNLFYLKI